MARTCFSGAVTLFGLPLEGEKRPEPYLQTKFNEGYAATAGDTIDLFISGASAQDNTLERLLA